MFNGKSLRCYQLGQWLSLLGLARSKADCAEHAHQKSSRSGGAVITQHHSSQCIHAVYLGLLVPCVNYDYLYMGSSAVEAMS